MKKQIDWVVVSAVVGLLLFVGIGVAVTFNSSSEIQKGVINYQLSDQEKPKAELSETNFDFGNVNVSDKQIKEITLKNTGQKPLSLFSPTTSCDCTSVQIKIGDQLSPEFSMGVSSKWTGEVAPGEMATIIAIYEPYKMPSPGAVGRTVMMNTNDPSLPKLQIGFKAFVEGTRQFSQ
jgi:hypothetical protein